MSVCQFVSLSVCQFVNLSVCQLVQQYAFTAPSSAPGFATRAVWGLPPLIPQSCSRVIGQFVNLAVCHVGSGARGKVVKRPVVSWSTFRLAGCQGVRWTVRRFVSALGGSWPVVNWAGCQFVRLSGFRLSSFRLSVCQFVSLSVCQVVKLARIS